MDKNLGIVIISLAAMAFNVAKVLIVKHACQNIDSRLVVLVGRAVSAMVLFPLMLGVDGAMPTDAVFWGVTLLTAIMTAAASVLFTEAAKKGPLSIVMPMQAVVPVFALLTLWIVWRETPSRRAVIWMLVSMAGMAWMLYAAYRNKNGWHKQMRYVLFSLIAAMLFGVSTVFDRTAIARLAHGALAYSACWNTVSAVLVFLEWVRKERGVRILIPSGGEAVPLIVYALSVLGAFTLQQVAVQLSLGLSGAIVNVKSLVMLHLPVVIVIGLVVFRERVSKQAFFAGFVALISGLALIRAML